MFDSENNKYESGLVPTECRTCGTNELIWVRKSAFDRALNLLIPINTHRCEQCHHSYRVFKSKFLFLTILVVLAIFLTASVTPSPTKGNKIIHNDKFSRTMGELGRLAANTEPAVAAMARAPQLLGATPGAKQLKIAPTVAVNKISVLAHLLKGTTADHGYPVNSERIGDWDIDKVMTLDPGHYTIQISSGRTLEAVQELVHQLITTRNMPEPFFFYRSETLPDTWYPILYGDFQNIQGARAAMAALPRPIRLKKPFIRKVASIHKKISG